DIYPYLAHMLSIRLEPALAERLAALDPQSLQNQYVAAFRELLQALAAQAPLVLVLEDVHWADPSSVEMLIKLLPLVFQARLLFCIVSRADRDVPGWKLITAAHELLGDSLLEIRLQPLTEAASQELVSNLLEIQDLPGNVRSLIYRKAEGNPFFVEEVIRMLIDRSIITHEGDRWVAAKQVETVEIPDTLFGLLLARIDRQPDDVKRTMRIASVIGRQFPVRVLEQVMERDSAQALAASLSTLESASLIRLAQVEPDLEYLFRHALIQDAAYESLLKKDRQRLHLAVGRILESLDAERIGELAPVLAHHFSEAGSKADALKYFILAGENAAAKYANAEAIAHFGKAIELCAADDLSLPRLHRLRGLAYETLGEFDKARLDQEAALEIARTTLNKRAEWQATLDLGMLWAGRDYGKTESYFRQALSLAEQLGDEATVAYSQNRIGNWYVNHEEPLEGLRYHQQALAHFEQSNDRRGLAETVDLMGMANWISGRPVQMFQYYQQAVTLFRELGDQAGLSGALVGLGVAPGLLPLPVSPEPYVPMAQAAAYLGEALTIAGNIGSRPGEIYAMALLSGHYQASGQYRRSLEVSEQAVQIAHQIEHHQWIILSSFQRGYVFLDIFSPDQALAVLEPAYALAQSLQSGYWMHSVATQLAEAYLQMNDVAAAKHMLETVIKQEVPASTVSERIAWLVRAHLCLMQGEAEGAMRSLDQLVADAEELGSEGEYAIAGVSLLRGTVLTEMIRAGKGLSDADRAETALHKAKAHAERWPKYPLLWRVHGSLGRLYSVLGRTQEAEQQFVAAQEIVDRLALELPVDLREGFLIGVTNYLYSQYPQGETHA
ncbi:MAG TPA: AAA family ATPase, partial [Aggregatilineales bacterium]|nr:AAA family ATPase [Aggregatilineales bacterium]